MKLATLFTVQTLTESEKKAFRMQYGIPYVIADDGGTIHYPTASDYHMARDFGFDANIVTLGSVAPGLQAQMSQISANATLAEIKDLAKAIVAEAIKSGATHFYCTGDPTLTIWANLYAAGRVDVRNDKFMTGKVSIINGYYNEEANKPLRRDPFICLQCSETKNPNGKEVVQWREMF